MMDMKRRLGRTVVIGGGVAGLLAARVLADHCRDVVVLEKDVLTKAAPRRGVPQGRHVHILLASGQRIIESHFPGIAAELIEAGALPSRGGMYFNGGYLLPVPSWLQSVAASRPLIEGVIRRRLMQIGNIRIMHGVAAQHLGASQDGSRVTGVAASGTEAACFLDADLVVDASGRGSRAARWLERIGYAPPEEDRISIPITYATRCFRRLPGDLAGDTFEMVASDQPCHRGGLMIAIEGGRWIVTLTGYGNQVPPQDLGGFIAYARSLPAPRMGDLVARAEPLDEGCTFHFPASLRRRWEGLARMPSGFLVIGDGICSLNPVHGQGMTVAAQESQALSAALAGPSVGLARRFFGAAARVVDQSWNITAGMDLQHPDAVGHRNMLMGAVTGYMNRLSRAAQCDAVVANRLYQALNLQVSSIGLLRPDIIVRTLFHQPRRPSYRARSDATLPVPQSEAVAGQAGFQRDRCQSR